MQQTPKRQSTLQTADNIQLQQQQQQPQQYWLWINKNVLRVDGARAVSISFFFVLYVVCACFFFSLLFAV